MMTKKASVISDVCLLVLFILYRGHLLKKHPLQEPLDSFLSSSTAAGNEVLEKGLLSHVQMSERQVCVTWNSQNSALGILGEEFSSRVLPLGGGGGGEAEGMAHP